MSETREALEAARAFIQQQHDLARAHTETSYQASELIDKIDRALSARDERAEGRGWMPIETAPKDGTQFIAYQDGEPYRCCWREPDYEISGGWYDFINDGIEEPTHWMPLPAPPAAIRAGGTDG